jgi:Ca2+-binding RTX toxin-like protein
MKKRIVVLTTLAAMLAAAMALSGVAQAKPTIGTKADAKCLAQAAQTLQPGFKPSDYTFHGGTEGDDNLSSQRTDDPDVFCGFGGEDSINSLDVGDIFLGGAGNDFVDNNEGTFYGQAGDDVVANANYVIFHGGEGNDSVFGNFGTIYGGEGNDFVFFNHPDGIFFGEEGDDSFEFDQGTVDLGPEP